MEPAHDFILTVAKIADHLALTDRTVRDYLGNGRLRGVRLDGEWRSSWRYVWAIERGPAPSGALRKDYQCPLLSKSDVARKFNVSERTVERWIAQGLPTRNVLTNVRVAPFDAARWCESRFRNNWNNKTAFGSLFVEGSFPE